jgi:hypothetical protein
MDYSYIIRRAFQITWNYRALWIFGILLAVTAGSIGRGGQGGVNYSFQSPREIPGIPWPPPQFPTIPFEIANILVTLGILLICLFFIFGIIGAVVRYVSETAAILMVDSYEETNAKVSVSSGFRLGWSTRALRVFLIDLLFSIAIFVIALILLFFAGAPLLLWLTETEAGRIAGVAIAVGLFLIVFLILFLIGIAYSLFSQFFRRAAIMENLGVFDAIGRGFSLVIRHLGQVILVGIILFVITILWGVLMIPVVIGVLISAGLLGALPGLLAGWIATFFTQGNAPIIIGIFFGLPAFLLALLAPLLWLNGLFELYQLSAWTLTYRQAARMDHRGLIPAARASLRTGPDPGI